MESSKQILDKIPTALHNLGLQGQQAQMTENYIRNLLPALTLDGSYVLWAIKRFVVSKFKPDSLINRK